MNSVSSLVPRALGCSHIHAPLDQLGRNHQGPLKYLGCKAYTAVDPPRYARTPLWNWLDVVIYACLIAMVLSKLYMTAWLATHVLPVVRVVFSRFFFFFLESSTFSVGCLITMIQRAQWFCRQFSS